jgi:selenocysteine lyase/cysteine desulfurase
LFDRLNAIPRLRIVSPRSDSAGRGMVAFRIENMTSLALQERLASAVVPAGGALAGRQVNVRTRVIGEYDYGWMRLSPHIYNTIDEIDAVSALIAEATL